MRSDYALRFVSVLLAAGIATHAPAQARLFRAPLACDRAWQIMMPHMSTNGWSDFAK